jgi:hypothetical protein
MATFDHHFEPIGISSIGNSVDLTPREIEDAGLHEVLQSPGAALGSWSLLGALLDGTTPDFVFREPLGRSREVKTALSGLFGRFVARAYASRHLSYTHFAHIHSPPMALAFGGGMVERVLPHDLPDWAAWNGRDLAIIEAKGSHAWAGPQKTLEGAYAQAERVEIRIGGKVAPFKRYAIATRWGFTVNGPDRPMLWVKDPLIDGEGVDEDSVRRLGGGIALHHYASLLVPLGHQELGGALRRQALAIDAPGYERAQAESREAFARTLSRKLHMNGPGPEGELVGGFVTRAGPIQSDNLSASDREVLVRLRMRPAFVGVERVALKAVIEGSTSELGIIQSRASSRTHDVLSMPRMDGSGTWVFRPDEDEADLLDQGSPTP